MSVIRSIGPCFYNLTKIIKIEKGVTWRNLPYIEITTNATNNFAFSFFTGFDQNNKIYFDSIDMCEKEYHEIKNILEDYYKK